MSRKIYSPVCFIVIYPQEITWPVASNLHPTPPGERGDFYETFNVTPSEDLETGCISCVEMMYVFFLYSWVVIVLFRKKRARVEIVLTSGINNLIGLRQSTVSPHLMKLWNLPFF